MSNDRELLELAAKAAGYDFVTWDGETAVAWKSREPTGWNPLTDDGDALRLAIKCKLMVDTFDFGMTTAYFAGGYLQDACTRRAIVRAAAAIGRSMQ